MEPMGNYVLIWTQTLASRSMIKPLEVQLSSYLDLLHTTLLLFVSN